MKTCFHPHFHAIFRSLYDGQLKQQTCYSFTLLISLMVLIQFKWQSSSFRLHQIFSILMVQMLFSQINRHLAPTSGSFCPFLGNDSVKLYMWACYLIKVCLTLPLVSIPLCPSAKPSALSTKALCARR